MNVQFTLLDKNFQPIANANVVLLDKEGNYTNIGSTTDSNGVFNYSHDLIFSGSYLRISHTGYTPILDTVKNIANQSIVMQDISDLNEVVITATKPKKTGWLWLLLLGAGITIAASTKKEKVVRAKI